MTSNPRPRLAGRVAIVTGAGQGIGAAVAAELARDGADVVVTDVNEPNASVTAASIRSAGWLAESMRLDVASAEDVDAVVGAVISSRGGVDILVNNAGTLRATPAAQVPLDEWEMILRINLTGAFLCCKAVFPSLVSRGGGRIINMGSIAGRSTSTIGGAAYTTSKSALMGLSRHLAKEWAAHRITVNSVCPGMVDTSMVRGLVSEEDLGPIIETIPLGRMAAPEEVGALVAFLASDAAAFITGASIDINGGELIVA